MDQEMTCERCCGLLQGDVDRGGCHSPEVDSHLQSCAACRAYAAWLEFAVEGLGALRTLGPRRRVGRALKQQLIREGVLVRAWSSRRVAGVVALGWVSVGTGLLLALRPGFVAGSLERVAGRALGLIRPLWVAVGGVCGRVLPVVRGLVRASDPLVSWAGDLPWLEASAVSLAAATATGVAVMWFSICEKRRFGHALFL